MESHRGFSFGLYTSPDGLWQGAATPITRVYWIHLTPRLQEAADLRFDEPFKARPKESVQK
ncbi:hypothetical protein ACFLXF_01375 [Chloroflexota bacterium]